jgi:hypothetical protein
LRLPLTPFVVGGSMLAAAGLAGYYAVRATSWAVMTDELQVAKLATSIADTLSPVPYVHGVYYGALSQLYPLLIAPFFGTLSAPAAETAAHALNALLLASAAWPAYLLARSVAASRRAGFAAAALTVFTPWLVLASTLLTENAAYPAFVWSVFLCHRTLAAPSAGRDVAALAGLLLAFFARTQLFVLALAFPVALVLHEVGFALAQREGPVRAAVSAAGSRAVAKHRVLAAVYGTGLIGTAALAFVGSLSRVVGNYATPFSGDLLPSGFWESAAAHFDQIVIGAGVLPFALAVSWTVTTATRPERKEGHAFAALFVVLVPLLTFEVTSFDLRYTPHRFIQDRYLFYLVPLLAVASAAWLVQRTHRELRVASLVAAACLFAGLVGFAAFDDPTIFWASPAGAFHPALATVAGWVGLSLVMFLRLVAVVLAALLAAAVWRVPSPALIGTTLAVAGFGAFEAGFVLDRYSDPAMTRPPAGVARDWIDASVPARNSVALMPSPRDNPVYWWEAEFWNKDVDRVLRVDSGQTFTPFPADDVSIDYAAGALRGPQPSDYLVVSPSETRFHVLEAAHVADGRPLRLVRVRRPYRLEWATRGVTADGWTRPGEQSTLRFYAHGRPGRRMITLTLAASRFALRPLGFKFRSGGAVVRGGVDPGGARPPIRLAVCVPPGGHADARLTTTGKARIPDGRVVALHLDRVQVSGTGPC